MDDVCGMWLEGKIDAASKALEQFDTQVNANRPTFEDDYFESYMVSARDALKAWVEKYGAISQRETIVAIQPKILGLAKVKVDYIVKGQSGLIVRERKVVSNFVDIDEEVEKYEMGMQPICYKDMVEEHFKETVECVEMEFLIRSAAAKGRYKAKPADARREPLYFDNWKQDMWYNTALYTNEAMKLLEESLESEHQFVNIPRFTRNCLVKLGGKTYPCDFYKACKVMMNPIYMPEQFLCDRKEAALEKSLPDDADSRVRSRLEGLDGESGGSGGDQVQGD